MTNEVYTLGVWRVKDGKQSEFVEAWKELGVHFRDLPNPAGKGTLLQSLDEPRQFYSFGPWKTLDDIQAMREHPDSPKEISKLVDLCDESLAGAFRVVATA